MKITTPTACALALIVSAEGAWAQTPSGLNDLVGARAAGGETALQSRGYRFIRGEKGDDRSYTFWWNATNGRCVVVATMEGRYASITATPGADCGQSDGRAGSMTGSSAKAQPWSPGYGEDRDRGQERYDVDGRVVDLGLVCFGDGQRPRLATTYGYSWNSRTHRYDYGDRTEMTGQQFDASVTLQLWSGGGRIRLPKKLVPPINTRGNDGWWDLYDVAMGPDTIQAKYRLNGLNKPAITINRRSGQITIKGTDPYAFRGTCDLIDGEDHRRF